MAHRRLLVSLAAASLLIGSILAGCGSPKHQTASPQSAPSQGPKGPLKFTLLTYSNARPYNPVGDRLAEAVQSELKKIGVQADIKVMPFVEFKKAVRQKDQGDAFFWGWLGDNGDPDNFLYVHYHSSQFADFNATHYKNPKVDDLLSQGQRETDPAKRVALYKEAQKLIAEDAPWIWFSWATDFAATRANVTGFQLHPTSYVDLRNVDISGVSGEKTLIYARGADSTALDPALIDDTESSKVVNQIYEGLLRYKAGSTQIEPSLATSWDVSADGKVYTFKLRSGVKFHDGTPFNADAVVYSIGRQLKGQDTKGMPYADFAFGMVDKVEKVDDLTVRFTLSHPFAPFLGNLAMGLGAPIVSPTAARKYGKDFGTTAAVGTGPFIFEKWDKDQQIVLRANPEYWGGKPKLDRVIFKVSKQNQVRADELLKGQVQVIDGIDPTDLGRLKASSDLKVISGPGMNINYMGFRTDNPPFDDVRVRRAVSMAVNRAAIVAALYPGVAEVANGALPPFMPGYDASLQPAPYDPAGARKLLQDAGYSTN